MRSRALPSPRLWVHLVPRRYSSLAKTFLAGYRAGLCRVELDAGACVVGLRPLGGVAHLHDGTPSTPASSTILPDR